MEVQLVDNVLREIQRLSHNAARDQLHQHWKYLQKLSLKIKRFRYLEYEADEKELNEILRALCL